MKKIFVIAALASLVLASCTKTATQIEGTADSRIPVAFKGYSAPVVKGFIPVSSFTDEGNKRTMQVSGFITTQDSTEFFVDKTFASNGTNWVATPTIYYPLGNGDNYAFLAFSDSSRSSYAWEGARKVSLEVDTMALRFDIVASNFYAKGENVKVDAADAVAAKFYHTQALVTVNVKAADETTEDAKVSVDTIILKNVYNIGKLTLTYNNATAISTASTGAHKPNIKWNFFGLCKCEKLAMYNGNFGTDDAGTISTNGNWAANTFEDSLGSGYRTYIKEDEGKIFEGLYPAEQKPTAIEFLYTVNGKQMSATWNLAANTPEWVAGKHYIYNVKIGMYEVMIAPEVGGDWEAVTPAESVDVN